MEENHPPPPSFGYIDKRAMMGKILASQTHIICKELAWRASNNMIPVNGRLFGKGVRVHPSCPLCTIHEETVLHALVSCDMVAPVWFASPLGIRARSSNITSFTSWLSHLLNKGTQESTQLLLNTLFAIWYRRNELVFKHKTMDIQQILDKANSMFLYPFNGNAVERSIWSSSQINGAVAAYVDATLKIGAGGTGAGLIVWDKSEEFMLAATKLYPETLDLKVAEAEALVWAMDILLKVGITRVTLFTHSLPVIQSWHSSSRGNRSSDDFEEIMMEGCYKRSLFTGADLRQFNGSHVNGSHNAADFLAKAAFVRGSNIWVDVMPPFLSQFVNDEPSVSSNP